MSMQKKKKKLVITKSSTVSYIQKMLEGGNHLTLFVESKSNNDSNNQLFITNKINTPKLFPP
jgi:hypothetical protein